jgi:hypothetical protein
MFKCDFQDRSRRVAHGPSVATTSSERNLQQLVDIGVYIFAIFIDEIVCLGEPVLSSHQSLAPACEASSILLSYEWFHVTSVQVTLVRSVYKLLAVCSTKCNSHGYRLYIREGSRRGDGSNLRKLL